MAAQGWTPVADTSAWTPVAPKPAPLSKNMDDDTIIRNLGFDPAVVKQSPLYQAGSKVGGNLSSVLGGAQGSFTDTDLRAAHGVAQLPMGALQFLAHAANKVGLIDEPTKQYTDMLMKLHETNYQQNVRHGDTSTDFVSGAAQVVGALATGQPETMLGRAALGAGISAVGAPETKDTSHLLTDAAKKGAIGALVTPALEGATSLIGKGVGYVAGKMRAGSQGALPPAMQQVEDLAAQHNVPVTAGDVSGNPVIQKKETLAESIPFSNMGKFREGQQKATNEAATNFLATMKDKAAQTPHDQMALIEEAATAGVKGAQELKDAIANAGDDTSQIIKNSGVAGIMTRKFQASVLYDKVGEAASTMGNVPLPQTMAAIKQAKDAMAREGLPDRSIQNVLDTLQTRLGSVEGKAPLADTSFNGIRGVDSDLGTMIAEKHTGTNAIIGQKGVGALQGVKDAVRADMDSFAGSGGAGSPQALWKKSAGVDDFAAKSSELTDAWKEANDYYKNNLVPYKSRTLAAGLGPDVPADEIFSRFIQRGREGRADLFYGALDSKGQAAVRTGIVSKAFDAAYDDARGIFSPVKFSSAIRNQESGTNAFFKGRDRFELDGITKLMDHVTRAGQYAENPPTGNRLVPMTAAVGLMAHPVAGIGALLSVRNLTKLTTSVEGRRYLLSASGAKVGSAAMDKITSQIAKAFPALVGTATADGAD